MRTATARTSIDFRTTASRAPRARRSPAVTSSLLGAGARPVGFHLAQAIFGAPVGVGRDRFVDALAELLAP